MTNVAKRDLTLNIIKSIKLSHFFLIREIARYGSLSKAASELLISQSAATKSLRSLEETLGVELFERTGRGVELTGAGEAFLSCSRKILSEFRSTNEQLADLNSGERGTVTVGEMVTASPRLLPQTLVSFRKLYPNVSVSIHEGTMETLSPALHVGDVDFAVGRLSVFGNREGLLQVPLYSEPVRIVCSKNNPKAHVKDIELHHLCNDNWILPPFDMVLRRELDRIFHDHNVLSPANAHESVSLLTNIAIVSQSDFFVALPEQVYLAFKEPFALHALPIELGGILGPVGYTKRASGPLSAAAQLLIKHLELTALELAEAYPLETQEGAG